MKKTLLLTGTAALALAVVLGAGALAAPGQGRYYTDADGDGVCDNRADGSCAYSSCTGAYCGYADTDGDGICDRWEDCLQAEGQRPLHGAGWGHHGGRHAG